MKTQKQGPWRYKSILFRAFLTCLALGSLAAGSARASTISGETIIFQDQTDTVSVSQTGTGGGQYSCNPSAESPLCRFAPPPAPPPGYTFNSSSTLINNGFFNILELGTTDTLSDQITLSYTLSGVIEFDSDSDPGSLGPANCGSSGVICVTEDGTVQTAGTIIWSPSSSTDCSSSSTTCIVDTIKFQSDLDTPSVPEPGTLVLFGSGLISIVGLARRKIFRA
jgi:hypothetical protein